jgi:hypothetical protein
MSVASLVSSAKKLLSRRAIIGAAAGLALAASASFPAAAQQATGFAQYDAQYEQNVRRGVANPADIRSRCLAEVRTRMSDAQIAANNDDIACSESLRNLLQDPNARARANGILAGRPVSQFEICNLLRGLTS